MSRPLIAALLLCTFAPSAAALEDPMRPPVGSAFSARASGVSAESGFVLSSTFITRARRVAVINGKRVEVGERIGGAEVAEILPTQVRLRQGGKEIIVRLLPVSVKTPAQSEDQEQR